MGQKVHPYGFRVGITKPWRSRWFARKDRFGDLLVEDCRIRKYIMANYRDAAVPRVEIERKGEDRVTVFIHTAKAGMLLGKKTNRLTEIEADLKQLTGGKAVETRLVDITRPEIDAQLNARAIADQIERRMHFRRAIKRQQDVITQAGAKGMKICISGRLGGADIARQEKASWGSVPLHTLDADVDYGFAEAHTTYGVIGVKVWINRGKIGEEQPADDRQGGRGRGQGGRGQWR